eukprot:Pgem_evm1s2427
MLTAKWRIAFHFTPRPFKCRKGGAHPGVTPPTTKHSEGVELKKIYYEPMVIIWLVSTKVNPVNQYFEEQSAFAPRDLEDKTKLIQEFVDFHNDKKRPVALIT